LGSEPTGRGLEDFPGQAAIRWEASSSVREMIDVGRSVIALQLSFFQECSRFVGLTHGASSHVLHLKQLLRVCFAFSFDASFPAFWDAERALSSRRPASRIFFSELAVSQLGKSAHKNLPGKRFFLHPGGLPLPITSPAVEVPVQKRFTEQVRLFPSALGTASIGRESFFKNILGRILITIHDQSTIRTNVRANTQRLFDDGIAVRTFLAGEMRWDGQDLDFMHSAIVGKPLQEDPQPASWMLFANFRLRTMLQI